MTLAHAVADIADNPKEYCYSKYGNVYSRAWSTDTFVAYVHCVLDPKSYAIARTSGIRMTISAWDTIDRTSNLLA